MPFPPRPECVPESPHRQLPNSSKSSGTPRVGMHLYQNDEEDDVSVLTFHTLGTKDATNNNLSSSGGTSFVKSARESLERLVLESKNSGEEEDADGKSLSRISEEGGSQMSSCHSKRGCDRSQSSKSSQMKLDDKDKIDEHTDDGERENRMDGTGADLDFGDDDTISLAESILDSANKVLSSIGSSPYYGRGKKQASPTDDTLPPKPSTKGNSPTKHSGNTVDLEVEDKESDPKSFHGTAEESPMPRKTYDDNGSQPEGGSKFLNSYFHDESSKSSGERDIIKYGDEKDDGLKNAYRLHSAAKNTFNDVDDEPTAASRDYLSSYYRDKSSSSNVSNHKERMAEEDDKENDSGSIFSAKKEFTPSKKMFNNNRDDKLEVSSNFLRSYFDDKEDGNNHLNHSKNVRIQKLESERKHLRSLLEERQFETRRASKSLGSSIRRANELLERLSSDRRS